MRQGSRKYQRKDFHFHSLVPICLNSSAEEKRKILIDILLGVALDSLACTPEDGSFFRSGAAKTFYGFI